MKIPLVEYPADLRVRMPDAYGTSSQMSWDLKSLVSLSIASVHLSSCAHCGDQVAVRAEFREGELLITQDEDPGPPL